MSLIPAPPLDDAGALRVGAYQVTAHLAAGPLGVCVMCTGTVWRWWDLTACDMPPVTDRYGQLTDQVPLHPSCVPELLAEWASIIDEGSDVAAAVSPDVAESPDVGALAKTSTRRAPTGAYAQ